MWLLVLGKLNVHSVLQKRRLYHMLSLGWCVLCRKENESINHLFLHCMFPFSLWCKVLNEFGVSWAAPCSCSDLLGLGQGLHSSKRGICGSWWL